MKHTLPGFFLKIICTILLTLALFSANAQTQVLTITSPTDMVVDGGLTITVVRQAISDTSSLSYTIINSSGSAFVKSDAYIVGLQAGTVTINVTSSGDSNYAPASTSQIVSIARGTPTLDIISSNQMSVGSTLTAAVTTSATYARGGSFTFTINSGSGSATVNPITGFIQAIAAGTVILAAGSSGDIDYNPGYTTQVITIGRGTPTLIITSSNTLGVDATLTAAVSATASVSSGGAVTFSITVGSGSATVNATTGLITGRTVGTVTLIAQSAGDTNYYPVSNGQIITIAKTTPTLIIISANTMTVDGILNVSLTTTASSSIGTFSYSVFSGTGSAFAGPGIGEVSSLAAGGVTLTVSASGNSNYYATSVDQFITILKSTPVLSISSSSTIILGAVFNAVTATTATYDRGGSVTFSIIAGSGSATVNPTTGLVTTLGAGTVTLVASSSGDGDYNAVIVSQLLTISKGTFALTITSATTTIVDGALTATITSTARASSGGAITYSISGGSGSATVNPTTGVIRAVSVGTVTLTVTTAGDTNYSSVSATVVITIGKSTPTLVITSSATIPPGSTLTATISTTATGGRGGTYTYMITAGSGSATVNPTTGVITGVSIGTVTLTVVSSGDSNYNSATARQLINIGANTPTVLLSFSPKSGAAGSTVVLQGQNFNPDPASNVVFFGATQATVVAASASSLTVTVPIGANYQLISITNLSSNSSAYSDSPFIVTFASSGTLSLSNTVTIGGITGASYADLRDLNADGKPDLVVINNGDSNTSRVFVFLNTSTAGGLSFTLVAALTPSVQVRESVDLFDVDGDGKLDVVLTGLFSGIVVYRNTTTALSSALRFGPPLTFASHSDLFTQLADLDGDGRPDIIGGGSSPYSGSANISILRNVSTAGSISFSTFFNFPSQGVDPDGVGVIDLDKDGKPDLVIGNATSGNLQLFHNISTVGNISFTLGQTISTAYNAAINFGDFDGDGQIDIVSTPYGGFGGGAVAFFRNTNTVTGTISFTSTPVVANTGYNNIEFTVNDLNGDGKPDVAAVSTSSARLSILQNASTIGNITFTSTSYTTGATPVGIVSTDMNGDLKPDIAVMNQGGNSISFYQNVTPIVYQPPIITTFSPASGPVSTTVTITGQNFNPIAARNAVFFGGTQVTVTAAGLNTLTVTVPYGADYRYLSVTNLDAGLTGYAATPFVVTSPSLSANAVSSFAPEMIIDAPFQALAEVVGDFDGDGNPDIVVGSNGAGVVSLFRNITPQGSASISFTTSSFTIPAVSNAVVGAIAADFDGDGKLDLAFTDENTGNGRIHVYRNISTSGSMSFTFATTINLGITTSDPFGLAAGDLDKDGKPDLVAVYSLSSTLSVIRNTSTSGTISFSAPNNSVSMPAGSTAVAIGDVDGDGRVDVVAAQSTGNTITLLRNTTSSVGNITLGSPVSFASATNTAYSVALGDFNNDGKLDIATGNVNQSSVSVFRNTAVSGTINAGSLAPAQIFTTGGDRRGVAIGDVNGDGKPDLVSLGNDVNDYNVSVLTNATTASTNISFSSVSPYLSSVDNTASVGRINLVDLNKDGLLDIVGLANGTGPSKVIIYRNVVSLPTPSIISISPLSGPVSTTITITGQNFNPIPGQNVVFFGAVQAVVTGATSTSLTVVVPAGASYQYLSTTNLDYGTTGYSTLPFNVTFSSSGDSSSRPASTITSGSGANTRDIALTDFNRDGKPDIAVANSDNTVSVFVNQVTSSTAPLTLSPGVTLGTSSGSASSSIVVGDINGDGLPDILVTNAVTGLVSIYQNTTLVTGATPTFVLAGPFSATANPVDMVMADVDGDGLLDIVTVNKSSNAISVLLNRSTSSTISFASPQTFATGTSPGALAIGDFNKDGKVDLAVVNSGSNTVSVFKNASSIGSVSWVVSTLATGTNPTSIVIADFDGDAFLDIATTNAGSNNISVFRNNGTTSTLAFASKADFSTGVGSAPSNLAVGDIDGDGKPDLLSVNGGNNTVSGLYNASTIGTLSFTINPDVTNGSAIAPSSVAIGDLNGDSKPDFVITVGGTSNNVALFLQKSSQTLAIGPISSSQVGIAISVTVSSTAGPGLIGSLSYTIVAGSGSATIDAFGNLMPISAGTITLTVFTAGSTDYASARVSKPIVISQGAQSLTLTSASTTTVGGTLTATVTNSAGSAGGAITFSITAGSGSATVNVNTGVITGISVGTVTLTVYAAGTSNYGAASISRSITVLQGVQMLTVTTANTLNVGDTLTSTVTRTTTGGRGGAITFAVVAGSGSATVNATTGVLIATGAGTITLLVNAAGDSNYSAASVSQSITIGKSTPTLTASLSGTLAVDRSLTVTVNSTAGAGRGGAITFVVIGGSGSATVNPATGVITGVNAGSITLTISSAGDSNYGPVSISQFITIAKGTPTLVVNSSSVLPIGGTITATVSSTARAGQGGAIAYAVVAGSGSATLNPSTGVLQGVSAGTVTLLVSTAGDANYAPATVSQLIAVATLSMSSSSTILEGSTGYAVLSLSPSSATMSQAVTFTITLNIANQANVDHYQVPAVMIFPAGQNSLAIPIQALSDNILYNDELLVLDIYNPVYGIFTASITITDATALVPSNRVITIGSSTVYHQETASIIVSLPDGIVSTKPIVIDLAVDPLMSSNLSQLQSYSASSTVTILANSSTASFEVSAAKLFGDPSVLVITGSISDPLSGAYTVQDGRVTVLAQRIAVLRAYSPNGDGPGDNFEIARIANFPRNRVVVYTVNGTSGRIVYQADGYNSDSVVFTGVDPEGLPLPSGSYYLYVQYYVGDVLYRYDDFFELRR